LSHWIAAAVARPALKFRYNEPGPNRPNPRAIVGAAGGIGFGGGAHGGMRLADG